jgi:deoxyribodipyrimidine photo-lyase
MRQLLQTGWMHNRLRMVVAAFLTKLLLIDWRKGEQFFMQHLIDGDFASNNGGWQWAASTGADAAPYFRIFTPLRQSERFDSEGVFIKKLLPELSSLDKKSIHNPSTQQRVACGYPEPIVDYKFARERALLEYAGAMGKGK